MRSAGNPRRHRNKDPHGVDHPTSRYKLPSRKRSAGIRREGPSVKGRRHGASLLPSVCVLPKERTKLVVFVFSITLLPGLCPLLGAPKNSGPDPVSVDLWPKGRAPNGDGTFDNDTAVITIYRPSTANGAVVIICPGGGYGGVVIGPEGHGIARWLNEHGIIGVVLRYRLPGGRSSVPLLDLQRAIRMVRSRGPKDWGCDSGRLGVMGFSAGGHLAATAVTLFDESDPESLSPSGRVSSRPDFGLLIYPVITMGPATHGGSRRNLLGSDPAPGLIELYSAEKQVTRRTPPCYLAHAKDDRPVPPVNGQLFHNAMKAAGVESEYLELPSGGQGLNGYRGQCGTLGRTGSSNGCKRSKFCPDPDPRDRRRNRHNPWIPARQ